MEWISLVGLIGFVGFALYRILGRRRRLREAAEAREAAFVASLRGQFAAAGADASPAPAEPAAPAPGPAAAAAAAAVAAAPRIALRDVSASPQRAASTVDEPVPAPAVALAERSAPPYLSARQLRVHALLRELVPACAVFPRSYLHWLVGASAGDKPQRLDFVCCDRRGSPRLVVDLARADDERAVWEFKRERLAAVGVLYLRWDVASLPSREALAAQLANVQIEPGD